MATAPNAAQNDIFTIHSKPGVQRDGTPLSHGFYQAAQWTRFQRGLPRKMGGYSAMSTVLNAPVRQTFVDARATVNTAHCFSQYGCEQLTFDPFTGGGSGLVNRYPTIATPVDNLTWSVDSMWDNTGGNTAAILCIGTPDLLNIASDAVGTVFTGNIQSPNVFTAVSNYTGNVQVSGGLCVIQPFLFVYGQMGYISNSNANDFSAGTGWSNCPTPNQAITVNVAGTKIVKGLPVRGGSSSPAGLFWALDSLILVSYIGGTALWSYSPQAGSSTVLGKNGIVEYDGIYYWAGVDRFFAYTGVIQELPNQMNCNWFFDNVNRQYVNKIWAMKVPRYGEIWWFYPAGSATECNAVVIYNVREQTWYDTACVRTAGSSPKVFSFPVVAGGDQTATTALVMNCSSQVPWKTGEVVTGGTSGATGTVVKVQYLDNSSTTPTLNLINVSGTFAYNETISDTLGNTGITNALNPPSYSQVLDALWQHEIGTDQIVGQNQTAIPASFTTANFAWSTGGPTQELAQGPTESVRITKFEPDFISSGPLTLEVNGTPYAQSQGTTEESVLVAIDSTVQYADLREQRRIMSLTVSSNVVGGTFQMGKPLATMEPGDERSA